MNDRTIYNILIDIFQPESSVYPLSAKKRVIVKPPQAFPKQIGQKQAQSRILTSVLDYSISIELVVIIAFTKDRNKYLDSPNIFIMEDFMRNKKYFFGVLSFIAISIFLFCCNSSTAPEMPEQAKEDPSFAQDIQQAIFSASCISAGCHNSTASAGLTLLQGQAYSNLVNVDSTQDPSKKRVLPSDANNSYLVIKLEGRQSTGSRMPLGGGALSSVKIQNIKNWINKGAKNN